MSLFREKFNRKESLFGTHVSLSDPVITEILGQIGFDYIWIDTEHSAISLHCLEQHLMAVRAAGIASVVRVPWFDNVRAKPVLEMGPDGIVFPMIHSYEEALEAMQGCLYPPLGKRGFGPRWANRFGKMPLEEYMHWVNHEMLKIIQIEHINAVRDLDRILTIDAIDACVIGPCDLTSSMGKLNQWEDPEVKEVLDTTMRKIVDAGKTVSVSFAEQSVEEMSKWMERGATMISIGMDTDYLQQGAKRVHDKLCQIYDKEQ